MVNGASWMSVFTRTIEVLQLSPSAICARASRFGRTLRWTGMSIGRAPGEATRTVPVYVPSARFAGFTDSVTEPGAVPVEGPAESQAPPRAVVVNGRGAPLLAMGTLRVRGAFAPDMASISMAFAAV